MGATFLAIPAELREMIFIELFSSTVVYYGSGKKTKKNTSILQTCRQIYLEATLIMHSTISLKFKNKALMKYWLARAHRYGSENIKYIRLQPYVQYLGRERHDVSTTLNTLNSLQETGLVIKQCNLDFVLTNRNDTELLPNIPPLINSDGWMELLLTIPVEAFKESKRYYEHFQPAKYPAAWNEMILVRGGDDSEAEVKMYIADDQKLETSCDDLASTTEHDKKDLLIVAKRGRGTRDIQIHKLAVTWRPASAAL